MVHVGVKVKVREGGEYGAVSLTCQAGRGNDRHLGEEGRGREGKQGGWLTGWLGKQALGNLGPGVQEAWTGGKT